MRTINALLHAVGLDASSIGTLLLSLSTIAGAKISNPSWVNFQSAGWVSFQSAPT
ncbi:putative DNA helicase, partial [Pseudomonas savastanoi pv. fraxini]